MKYFFAAFLVIFFFNFLSCQKKEEPLSVILITIDTLRADHLSCYGYRRNTSPNIDNISKEGVFFQNAVASSSFTPPSMATIFTSKYPSSHGVKHGVFKKNKVFNQEVLSDSIQTLAEILKENGYATYGFHTNPHLSKEFGFAQGFDFFNQFTFYDALELNSEILRNKDKIKSGGKYFLWVHYFDPHWPYLKRTPWIKKYSSFKSDKEDETEYADPPEKFSNAKNLKNNRELLSYIIARYDSEINFVDRYVGELLQFFKPEKNTLVIITSDHGEEFFEHDEFTHGHQLYEESIKVPLIIYAPSKFPAGVKIREQVGIIDIMPTILDILKIKSRQKLSGESLLPLISGNKKEERILYSELARGGKDSVSARFKNWKYIYDVKENKDELYDLNSDHGERDNIASVNEMIVKDFQSKVKGLLSSSGEIKSEEKPVGKNVVESLKSLGYIN